MSNRAWISTTTFNKAYLAVAWKNRSNLKDYERRGFAQFIYLTASSHLESLISQLIERRLQSVRTMVRWEKLPPINYQENDNITQCSIRPLIDSLQSVIDGTIEKVRVSQLSGLKTFYAQVFNHSLKEAIGSELDQDIQALSNLRNIFAHGRDLHMTFESFPSEVGTLDDNPLKHAAQRLFNAKIIKDFKITGMNYHDFQGQFYSDEAILYFYKSVMKAESALKSKLDYFPETRLPLGQPLPELAIEQMNEPQD